MAAFAHFVLQSLTHPAPHTGAKGEQRSGEMVPCHVHALLTLCLDPNPERRPLASTLHQALQQLLSLTDTLASLHLPEASPNLHVNLLDDLLSHIDLTENRWTIIWAGGVETLTSLLHASAHEDNDAKVSGVIHVIVSLMRERQVVDYLEQFPELVTDLLKILKTKKYSSLGQSAMMLIYQAVEKNKAIATEFVDKDGVAILLDFLNDTSSSEALKHFSVQLLADLTFKKGYVREIEACGGAFVLQEAMEASFTESWSFGSYAAMVLAAMGRIEVHLMVSDEASSDFPSLVLNSQSTSWTRELIWNTFDTLYPKSLNEVQVSQTFDSCSNVFLIRFHASLLRMLSPEATFNHRESAIRYIYILSLDEDYVVSLTQRRVLLRAVVQGCMFSLAQNTSDAASTILALSLNETSHEAFNDLESLKAMKAALSESECVRKNQCIVVSLMHLAVSPKVRENMIQLNFHSVLKALREQESCDAMASVCAGNLEDMLIANKGVDNKICKRFAPMLKTLLNHAVILGAGAALLGALNSQEKGKQSSKMVTFGVGTGVGLCLALNASKHNSFSHNVML
mmetsp:Transcript_7872/g.10641  ORF Transcript_7872/g.10641 Transcript_7872/m.10641 type:complete len:569 (-) Transcript_7872:60-1766(-)